ncbi:MAG: shikimate kinase [Desulfobulbaceae bacterium]|nr:shikimate kinase [Desulfobulbaceae bacterium]HIJ90861.1 shikimate kinase [Deltaproteobacteria bacterium]
MFTPQRKIILTGYRATGKTLVGQMLAQDLDLEFLDMDPMLEARAGQPIRQIVAQQGWGQFRLLERDLLAELVCCNDVVISTGGGAILHQGVWNLLRQTGLVVWLTADIDTICRRLAEDEKSTNQRPSLTDSDIYAEVAQVLAEREPLYKKGSQLTVDTGNKSAREIVHIIEKALGDDKFLRKIEASLPKDPIYC